MSARWLFEGVVYDLLSTRGVYGAKLVFSDAQGRVVDSVTTVEEGAYAISLPVGPPEGYSVRVIHEDYAKQHIDELDSTVPLSKASFDDRKLLMSGEATRQYPWVGAQGHFTRRDLLLKPIVGLSQ